MKNSPPSLPDFGPHVVVYGPESTDFSAIEAHYRAQRSAATAQFGDGRVAFLFLPGRYRLDLPLGYYTQVVGLGLEPGDVTIEGDVRSEAALSGGNATCNFWRGLENFTVVPTVDQRMKWAVAQATPFRRMVVNGDLHLADQGSTPWSSGGFLDGSTVTGTVRSLTQQQWFSRHSRFGGWEGGNWNMAFVGVEGGPAEGAWSKSTPCAVLPADPRVVGKPRLGVEEGRWGLIVPGRGTIDLAQVHLARADRDTAATLNAALAAGRHLLLTPGVYRPEAPVTVQREGTVILGLGFATLAPTGPFAGLEVADVDGVRVAGILVDAAPTPAAAVVRVGSGTHRPHADPIVFHDLVVRVGNGRPASAEVALAVDADDVVLDHAWLWVADHDARGTLPWDENWCPSGLVVTGHRVRASGLFVEHFQHFQTDWRGEDGEVLFYQSELPYRAPADWSSAPGTLGWASYRVAPEVQRHRGWAIGVYQVFGHDVSRAVEAPEGPGIEFSRLMTTTIVNGSLLRVINDRGDRAGSGQTAYWKGEDS